MLTCFGARLDCRVKSDAWLVPRRPSLPIPFAIGPFGKVSKTWSLFGVHCHFRLASVHTIISQSWHGLHKQDIPKKNCENFLTEEGGMMMMMLKLGHWWAAGSLGGAALHFERAEQKPGMWFVKVKVKSEGEKGKWNTEVKYENEIWKWKEKGAGQSSVESVMFSAKKYI